MAKLRMVVTHTPKDPNFTVKPLDYLSTVTSLPAPYDYTTIKAQADDHTLWAFREASPFRQIGTQFDSGSFATAGSIVDGATQAESTTFLVDDISTVAGLTADNAYDISSGIHANLASTSGAAELHAWVKAYRSEHFTTTWTATIEP